MTRGILTLQLFRHISRRRRYQFGLLLGLTLASSFAEVISLGAIVPFIGILTQPEKAFAIPRVAAFAHVFGVTTAAGLVLPLSAAFAIAAVVAGALRLALLRSSTFLANATGADLSLEMYRRTLYQPYRVHVSRSSSEIISGITQKVVTATTVLVSLANVATAAILFVAILITLLFIDPTVATVALVGFGSVYGIIVWRTRRRLLSNSRSIAREQTQVVKALQEGLGAIRDVLLDGTQDVYTNVYRRAIHEWQWANGQNAYFNLGPRYVTEALGIVLISGLTVFLTRRPGGIGSALPVLGALALGAQRLLPLMQQLYANWNLVAGSHGSLVDVLVLLDQPLPEVMDDALQDPMPLRKDIRFEHVRFRYGADHPLVLDDLHLTIPKGARVGLIGKTGSGKSTALDILMALLEPTEGALLVDGCVIDVRNRGAWQRTIAHVPQSIYLADASIAENIAFGIVPEQIDIARVRWAAEQAQIAEFVESRPEGYQAWVGERGIRLSGGQRQRIGIARALYKRASVLVFDEATSALDGATEDAVMDALGRLDQELTVVIIAHRLTTLRHCDTVVRLDGGRVAAQTSYQEVLIPT